MILIRFVDLLLLIEKSCSSLLTKISMEVKIDV